MADRARVVAVASGKGGTGKSVLAANLGVFLATLGKRVVVIDASFGSANLHSFVGVVDPSKTLYDCLRSGIKLTDVTISTSVSNVSLVAGALDPPSAARPTPEMLENLWHQIGGLDAEYVILDLSGGTREELLDLWIRADDSILTILAEPTAIELCYRFIKAGFVRLLESRGHGALAELRNRDDEVFGVPAPSELLASARDRFGDDSDEVAVISAAMEDLRPLLVLNQARSKSDMDLGAAVAKAASRRFGLRVPFLGHLEYDDAVWVSLRRRRPLLIEHPETRASKCVEKLTRRLLGRESDQRFAAPVPDDTHYGLLDIEPTASDEEIRRANRRVKQTYARESIVIGGLYSRERLERIHKRLEEAYETLMDPSRRKSYDQALFPDGLPSTRQSLTLPAPRRPTELPAMPEIGDATEYTGPLLQKVREAQGLELREIAERTKIGMSYLAAIEAETFAKLPATVYVRGFLTEYAKMLQLDPDRVLESYLSRYQRARAQSGGGDF